MTREKFKATYRYERNKAFAEAWPALSIGEIARNPQLNPEGLTPQRVHQIVKHYNFRVQV